MAKIQIHDLDKTYPGPDGKPMQVLRSLSLDVPDQTFVCILGPSGSGKSTTLDVLAGLTRYDGGEITVDGSPDLSDFTFGYVFQRPRLLNWRTIRQNLTFALKAESVPRSEWDERVDKYLELVGLSPFAGAYPLTLSGGMQQRVAIARALVIEPDVLLMDEPFSSLDELTARRLRTELTRIWSEQRKTVMFVTHNALEAAYLGDLIYTVSPRPATVVDSITVDVERPRKPDDPRLIAIQQQIIRQLEGEDADAEDPDLDAVHQT